MSKGRKLQKAGTILAFTAALAGGKAASKLTKAHNSTSPDTIAAQKETVAAQRAVQDIFDGAVDDHGSITGEDMTAMLNRASRQGAITPAEIRVRMLFEGYPTLFEPGARAAYGAYVAREMPVAGPMVELGGQGPLADPALPAADVGTVHWARVDGQAFVGQPSPSDVDQGLGADCWLLGGMAGVAQDPNAVRLLIQPHEDGTYTVHLYDPKTLEPVQVDIDGDLPVRGGRLVYAHNPNGALWPALVEKAAAQVLGGYDAILHGRPNEDGLRMLTGLPYETIALRDASPETWNWLKSNAHYPLSAAIVGDVPANRFRGLQPNHAYTMKISPADEPTVDLRNTWGTGAAYRVHPKANDDGEFKVPFTEMCGVFVVTVPVFPPASSQAEVPKDTEGIPLSPLTR